MLQSPLYKDRKSYENYRSCTYVEWNAFVLIITEFSLAPRCATVRYKSLRISAGLVTSLNLTAAIRKKQTFLFDFESRTCSLMWR